MKQAMIDVKPVGLAGVGKIDKLSHDFSDADVFIEHCGEDVFALSFKTDEGAGVKILMDKKTIIGITKCALYFVEEVSDEGEGF